MRTEFLPQNPFRPLDWRWQLALHLIEHPSLRRPRWIDAPVRRARRFLLIQQKRLALGRTFRPERVDPLVHQALEVHHNQPRRRLELEARLLAGQDDETIAQPMALAPELVALFAGLFHDVRDHLPHRDYILSRIHRGAWERGYCTREEAVRLFAYMRGPAVVEGVLEIYDTPEISALFAKDANERLELDVLRLAFELKLLDPGAPSTPRAWKLAAMTLKRLDSRPESAPGAGGLEGLDLSTLRAGSAPSAPDLPVPVPERRVRYAT